MALRISLMKSLSGALRRAQISSVDRVRDFHFSVSVCKLKSYESSSRSSSSFRTTRAPENAVKQTWIQSREYNRESSAKKLNEQKEARVSAAPNLYLEVIGTGAPASPACLYITSRSTNYIVNCGEGVQRILVERGVRLSRVGHIFCTSKSWRNIGGLLGLCLSLQVAGVPEVTIHGDANCQRMLRVHSAFADDRFFDSRVRYYDHRTVGWYEDSNFSVRTIELNTNVAGDGDQMNAEGGVSGTHLFVFKPKPMAPQINFSRCVELGITNAQIIKELESHLNDPSFAMTLTNGRVVKPADICWPASRNGPIVLFECPSLAFLRNLLQQAKEKRGNTQEQHVFSEPCDGEQPELIVHMTHFKVNGNDEYQRFMDSFPRSTRHLVLDGSCATPPCEYLYRNQAIMNLAHPQLFPLLPIATAAGNQAAETNNVTYGRPGLVYQMRPEMAFNDHSCLEVSNEKLRQETLDNNAGLQSILASLSQRRRNEGTKQPQYPCFVFLGTGSSTPNKTRNVSSLLLEIDQDNCVLFDCGEGTYSQLVRHYGAQTDAVLRRLRAVFISHMHADHHTGVFTLLTEWNRLVHDSQATWTQSVPAYRSSYNYNFSKKQYNVSNGPKLLFVCPKRYSGWLHSYIDITLDRDNALLQNMEIVSAQELVQSSQAAFRRKEQLDRLFSSCGFRTVTAVPVLHAGQPFGYVVTLRNGTKLVYSGDTMPCDALVNAGFQCDLLVHEATFEDDFADSARRKRHSTVSQAVQVARRMQAKRCVLTHFSQRYADIPAVYYNSHVFQPAGFHTVVGVAFDHMRFTLDDVEFTQHLLPFLKTVFTASFDSVVTQQQKRNYARLRQEEGFR